MTESFGDRNSNKCSKEVIVARCRTRQCVLVLMVLMGVSKHVIIVRDLRQVTLAGLCFDVTRRCSHYSRLEREGLDMLRIQMAIFHC